MHMDQGVLRPRGPEPEALSSSPGPELEPERWQLLTTLT